MKRESSKYFLKNQCQHKFFTLFPRIHKDLMQLCLKNQIFFQISNFSSEKIDFTDAYGGHSNESFCSSDLSIDGTEAGFEIGDNDGNATDGNSHGAHHNSSVGPNQEMSSLSHSLHNAMHNPIDKLFMMQNSYFNADHV